MASSDSAEFRLVIQGFSNFDRLIHDFLEETLSFAGYSGEELEQILLGACTVLNLVEKKLEVDENYSLPVELSVNIDRRSLSVSIIEQGEPLADRDQLMGFSEEMLLHKIFDEMHWVQLGVRGSEIRLHRIRNDAKSPTLVDIHQGVDSAHHEQRSASSAPRDMSYEIRRFRSGDELEISRQFYKSYGRSYPNPDLLYPERILAMNNQGLLHSVIVETEDGSLAGHYGIERPDLGPIGEAGLAVIDPGHRGRGLLTKMRSFLVDEARALGLLGLWSQPTARQSFSQKMNIKFGSTIHGLSLGTTPSEVELRGADGEDPASRYSCFLYWYPMDDEAPILCSVPESQSGILGSLYDERGRPHQFDVTTNHPPEPVGDSSSNIRGSFNRARRTGMIQVSAIDQLTLSMVRQLTSDLVDFASADVIYLDLPITDVCCAWLAEALRDDGFILCGIGPRFLSGEDSLRLQRLLVHVAPDSLVVEGDLASRLADHVFDEFQAWTDSRVS
jgi:hypothetical protein